MRSRKRNGKSSTRLIATLSREPPLSLLRNTGAGGDRVRAWYDGDRFARRRDICGERSVERDRKSRLAADQVRPFKLQTLAPALQCQHEPVGGQRKRVGRSVDHNLA